MKCTVIMIIRATQKKMMSKPVTSTVDGRNRSCSTVLPGQPSVENGTRAEEYQVSSTSGSRVSGPGVAGLRGAFARLGLAARDEQLAVRAVPGRDLVAPPELARDAPVLDVLHPLVVGVDPLLGHELRTEPSSTTSIAFCAIDLPSAPGLVIATNHWSVSIGSMKLPVRFAIDRAGLVGADGATHAGAFDTAYLGCLPGFVLMAAADEADLVHMVATACAHDEGPIALRYPRGEGLGVALPETGMPLEIGRGRVLREGTRVAILSYGTRLGECLEAAERLDAMGLSTTVADARFAKPLDRALIRRLAQHHEALITVEEGSVGGFGSFVLHALADDGLFEAGLKIKTLTLPDRFQDQDSQARLYAQAGLDADAIVAVATGLCRPAARRSAMAGAAGLRLVPAIAPGTVPLHEAST